MKTVKHFAFAVITLAGLSAIAIFSTKWLSPAQAQLSPATCQCTSTPLNLAGTTSAISNCQCGAMQCVALSNTALQCK